MAEIGDLGVAIALDLLAAQEVIITEARTAEIALEGGLLEIGVEVLNGINHVALLPQLGRQKFYFYYLMTLIVAVSLFNVSVYNLYFVLISS